MSEPSHRCAEIPFPWIHSEAYPSALEDPVGSKASDIRSRGNRNIGEPGYQEKFNPARFAVFPIVSYFEMSLAIAL